MLVRLVTTTVDSQSPPRQGIVKLALAALVLALLLVPALAAQAAPGDTVLVTQADGAGANGESGPNVAVSAGGRFVAFESTADNLSNEDNDAVQNVFVRDTETGVTSLVSRATGTTGAGADADAANPAISSDGRYVAFESRATNLSNGDNDAVVDVFLRDTQDGTTRLMSRATGPNGAGGDGDSRDPAITVGPAVAFDSTADNLSDEDGDGTRDVFLRVTSSATTTLISRAGGPTGDAGNADSYDPSVDANGQRVAFTSQADNLSTGANPSVTNVFVYDTITRFVSLASRAPGSGTLSAGADADSSEPSISPDGRCVSFTSYANNLDSADPPTPAFSDVFVRDIQANTITLASRASGAAGAVADGSSSNSTVDLPAVEGGGIPPCEQRSVAFLSSADNLSAEDNATFDVFARDMYQGLTQLVSRASGELGDGATGSSFGAALSPEGAFVAFVSEADNLSGGDDDRFKNVYLRALLTGPPPPPPPPPDLGDNDHSHHGGTDHTEHSAAEHAGHSAAEHAGHAGSVLSGSIIFADGKQRVGKLFVMATLHEAGRITVKATVRLGGGASRLYRFKSVNRAVPLHTLKKIRLRLSASKLRAVRRALRRGHKLRARVTGTAQYASGNKARTTRKIKLRP
jgi:hypothetical protein